MGGEEWGGNGNRKETKARDMRSKARLGGAPLRGLAGTGTAFPHANLVAGGGLRGISNVK